MSHLVKKFPTNFERFFGDMTTADTVLILNGESFHIHRLVLSLHSDVLRTLLYTKNFKERDRTEIVLDNPCDVSTEIFREFLYYLYSAKLKITEHNVVKMYELSDFYQVGHLKHMCIQSLYEEIKKGDYLPALEMVNKYYDEELLRLCIDVISKKIRNHEDLDYFCRNVSYSSLIKVLQHDHLNVSEETVLEIALKYIELQPSDEGKQVAPEILECVRFHLMTGSSIVKLVPSLIEKGFVKMDHYTKALEYQFDPSTSELPGKRRIRFCWDVEDMKLYHNCFTVSNDEKTVRRTRSSGINPSMRTKVPLSPANPFVEVRMQNFSKWNCIGLVEKKFRLIGEFVGNDTVPESGFGIYIGSTNSACYVKNSAKTCHFTIKQKIIRTGDTIGLRLDGDCVIFYHNSKELGKAYLKNKTAEYYPCVSMGFQSEWCIL